MAREFLVTSLRSIFFENNLEWKTSELAKYKTNIQMGGAGIIFLTYLFRDSSFDQVILLFMAVTVSLAALTYYVKTRRHGTRVVISVSLMTGVFLVGSLFDPYTAISIYVFTVLFISIFSGLQYVLDAWRQLSPRAVLLKKENLHKFIYYPLIFPVIFVGVLYYAKVMTWAVILIFSWEFASSGLENHMNSIGKKLSPAFEYLKSTIQIVGGVAILVTGFFQISTDPLIFTVILAIITASTSALNALYFYNHRSLLLTKQIS
jgi:phosphatidylglycerophosphate synthase